MLAFRKMKKQDVPALYEMAVRAFQPDFEKYGVYPPLLNMEKKKFIPPLVFGLVIVADGVEVGGAFVSAFGSKGELGAIFIDPAHQNKGYGRQALTAIEKLYPKVKRWRLETPGESGHLHRMYESVGYGKTGEIKDPGSGMIGFVYEKAL